MLDALSTLAPLVLFNGNGRPARSSPAGGLARQRIAIEVPSDIAVIEKQDSPLAGIGVWQPAGPSPKRLQAGFFVAEFCRTVRGQQGPGVYLLEKGKIEDYVPELASEK